jgi:hypothetical protein
MGNFERLCTMLYLRAHCEPNVLENSQFLFDKERNFHTIIRAIGLSSSDILTVFLLN